MMQVSDTEMAGNGRNGDNGDDTTATGNGSSVLAVRGKVLGKRSTVTGSKGSKSVSAKAAGPVITKDKKSNATPASSTLSVQNLYLDSGGSVQNIDPRTFKSGNQASSSRGPKAIQNVVGVSNKNKGDSKESRTSQPAAAYSNSAQYGPLRGFPSSDALSIYTTPPKENNSQIVVAGEGQITQRYGISSEDQDRAAEEREKWRQVSHAWAARLMTGMASHAEEYKERLQQAFHEAVYKEKCANDADIERCLVSVKKIFLRARKEAEATGPPRSRTSLPGRPTRSGSTCGDAAQPDRRRK